MKSKKKNHLLSVYANNYVKINRPDQKNYLLNLSYKQSWQEFLKESK